MPQPCVQETVWRKCGIIFPKFWKVMNRRIYNADEMDLFYNCLPDKRVALKGENCHIGKHSKNRFTVLLCSNSNGSDKIKLVVIKKFKNPKCF
ncbi:hypothetical protein PR048_001243 [Dryococelus australis]|uniref:DDE-1 domain-containing protein n=1 Tax=Dryococelus australis TaxID=614101 RepID=A0ABQ9IGU6_9NEOP|nr:hypothetical protein PR048_001243 [Dryococelus australis]